MRALVIVVLLAAIGWCGYWVVGARALDRAVERWLSERRAEGWLAEAADMRVRGFPNRFDLALVELDLADPETGLAWSAPFFQILALSYRPNHVIAVWPPEQTFASPDERVSVASDEMRGSLVLEGTNLALDRATFVADAVRLASDSGWQTALSQARLAVRRTAATTYDIGAETLGLVPGGAIQTRLDPADAFPDELQLLRLDATVAFDAPWDLGAIEDARPQPVRIAIDELTARWGEMDLRVSGALDIGPGGVPEGRITVEAENWREMLEIAIAAGAVSEAIAPTIERALGVLAGMSGNGETLDAPLDFGGGRITFGPVPLGPAPRLILR